MEHIEMKISQLVDSELSDTEQIEIFDILAKDQKARQIYSELLKLKKEVAKHHSEVRADLFPLKINKPLQVHAKPNIYKIGFAFSSAAAIILVMLLWFGDNKVNYNRLGNDTLLSSRRNSVTSKTYYINKTANDSKEIKTSTLTHSITERRIIKKKIINNDVITKSPDDIIQIIQLTKNDFLTSQIVGN